jgi:hypothetical protein
MNWEAIGAIGEILGAVAVFGSLLYLGLQIKHSRQSSQAETERQLIHDWREVVAGLWGDTEIASIILKGQNEGLAALTPEEANVFVGRIGNMLNHHYSVLRMSQKEMVDDHFLNEMTRSIVMILRSKGGQDVWAKTQDYYPNAIEINAALQNADSESWTEWAAELQRDASQ